MLYATNQVVRTDLIIFTPLKDSVFNVNKQKIVIVEAINKINLPFDVRWILKLIPLCNPDWITQRGLFVFLECCPDYRPHQNCIMKEGGWIITNFHKFST